MNLDGLIIWQQAAGDTDRNYVDLCIRWGVILNGPGDSGSWLDLKAGENYGKCTPRKTSDLRRFAEDMKDGDIVVLRLGTSRVVAVGHIVGGYEWHDAFGDVDGWELQHVRRVRWLWTGAQDFDTYALKQGDTTQRLNEGPVREWLAGLLPPMTATQPLCELPRRSDGDELPHDVISSYLFDNGVASASIGNLFAEIGELTRIAKWYWRTSPPSEHETVAYLVVPLLRALGWTPQRMAVEWNYLDIALFERLPRSPENLRVVVEAKKMGRSCLSAKAQALGYADGKLACHRLIVTDGMRYGVYYRDAEGAFQLYAYLNLARLRRHYPVYDCHGAKEALLAMAPEWNESTRVAIGPETPG